MAPPESFADYPKPVEWPATPAQGPPMENPVLRGLPLVVGANLIAYFPMLQKIFWANSGMGLIKDIPELEDVPYRFQPNVTPLGDNSAHLPFEADIVKPSRGGDVSKPRYYTAADFHELYKTGTTTPLQVAQTILSTIRKGQTPPSKYEDAWLAWPAKEQLALEAAKASTERYAAGTYLGVLDGVPIGVKDDIELKGYISQFGMKHRSDVPFFKEQEETSWPIQKLQEAGAIVIGKNKMHECGAETSGHNIAQGTPTNHLNTSYYPGGSTSGGSSAVGAGIVPLVVGTDAGGSTRVPAAFNGIYGMKPTQHRTVFMKFTTCVTGPIAASASDLTIAYRLMAQPNPDCASGRLFAASQPPAPGAKRYIGIYRDWWAGADPKVQQVCEKAVDRMAARYGYEVVDISIPFIPEARSAHSLICVAEMAEMGRRRTPNPADWLSLVSPANKLLMSVATQTPSADYIKSNCLREVLMQHLAFLFQKYPNLLIVTPTTPIIGWPRVAGDDAHGMSNTNISFKNMMYVFLSNLTGTPSLSAPAGYVDPDQGEGRLSIGMMATAEWGAEELLLTWAREAEEYLHEEVEPKDRRPTTWFDVLGATQKATG